MVKISFRLLEGLKLSQLLTNIAQTIISSENPLGFSFGYVFCWTGHHFEILIK